MTDDELRAWIREVDDLTYDRQRVEIAKGAGIRVAQLDKIRTTEKTAAATKAGTQAEAEMIWPTPVDGAPLLESLAHALVRFVVADKAALDACALWILHAHAHEAFDVSPLLLISSPVKGCGKSTLLDVIEQLVPRPLTSANSSAAALYRSTDRRPTILCDEADLFFGEDRSLVAFFNAGHRRGVPFMRVEGQETRRVVAFDSWAPKVLAQIGMPRWATVLDRSIVIHLRRKGPGEKAEKFRRSHAHEDLARLRQQAARWAADHLEKLRKHEPDLPESLDNRAADNWAPLFGIAQLAGGSWPAHAKAAAKALQHADEDLRVELLADLRALFASDASTFWPTTRLIESLIALEERPYATSNNGKPINAHWLARQLRGFSLRSTQERENGTDAKVRGWMVAPFEGVFSTYLPALPLSEASEASEAADREGGLASDASHASDQGSAGGWVPDAPDLGDAW